MKGGQRMAFTAFAVYEPEQKSITLEMLAMSLSILARFIMLSPPARNNRNSQYPS